MVLRNGNVNFPLVIQICGRGGAPEGHTQGVWRGFEKFGARAHRRRVGRAKMIRYRSRTKSFGHIENRYTDLRSSVEGGNTFSCG